MEMVALWDGLLPQDLVNFLAEGAGHFAQVQDS